MGEAGAAFDVVVIGGGIAGNALATVLARAGTAVVVLEQSTAYRDRVRGEYIQPWAWARPVASASTRCWRAPAASTTPARCRTTRR